MPLKMTLMPINVPMTQIALDGQCRQTRTPRIRVMIPSSKTHPECCFAQFFAKPAHIGIDGSGVDCASVAPGVVQQTVPRLNSPWPVHQHAEQLELNCCQNHRLAADQHTMLRGIDRIGPRVSFS